MKPDYPLTPFLHSLTVRSVPNHYLSIGFDVAERMAVVDLIRRVITEGSSEPLLDGGRLVRLHDQTSGARVNVVVDHTGMVRSAKPSFRPTMPRRVRALVSGLLPDPANPDADLVQLAPIEGAYPLPVELEDGTRAVAELPFGEAADFELVGFADSMECYASEEAYRASGMPMGTRAVLPAGLIPLATAEGTARPRATALVTGAVLECVLVRNEAGGADFFHLVIETDGMTFDAVVAPDAVTGPVPEPGHLVTGSLWFVARQPVAVSVGARPTTASEAQLDTLQIVADPPSPSRQSRTRLFSRWC